MSRYCAEKNTGPILEAAVGARRGLGREGSVFSDKHLWTTTGIEELHKHIVQHPDEGEGKFIEKLHRQIVAAPSSAKQLAAEMFWVMYLCPSSLTIRHKRDVIGDIWS